MEFASEKVQGGRQPMEVYAERARLVHENSPFKERVSRILAGLYADQAPKQHVEQRIYDGFPSRRDEWRMSQFHPLAKLVSGINKSLLVERQFDHTTEVVWARSASAGRSTSSPRLNIAFGPLAECSSQAALAANLRDPIFVPSLLRVWLQ